MSLIPVIYLSTNSVRFLPFTWILLLVLDATKHQQSVLYECIRGGLVITADAATFELFKIAANIYNDNLIWLPLHVAA
jgi:hypothetical protein